MDRREPGLEICFYDGLWKRLATTRNHLQHAWFFLLSFWRCTSNLDGFFHSAILHLTHFFSLQVVVDLTKPLQEQFLQILDALGRQYPDSDPSPRTVFC